MKMVAQPTSRGVVLERVNELLAIGLKQGQSAAAAELRKHLGEQK